LIEFLVKKIPRFHIQSFASLIDWSD